MLFQNQFVKTLLLTSVCVFITCKEDVVTDDTTHQLSNLDKDESGILVISLLDGSLIGVELKSGHLKWRLQNEPIVKVPAKSKNNILPIFLPDPKDGTLYSLNTAEHKALKKLPFTIQQLVASSPSRSSDGIFYSGKKIDTWFSVDLVTGKKLPLGNSELDRTCPIQSSRSIFIGRTEYNLIMLDSKSSNRHWNITYYDYTSHYLTKDQSNNYGYVHIGSSVSGRVRTWDRNTGELLWEKDFGSPMVSIFKRRGHDIITLPFSSVAESTFDLLPFSNEYKTLQSTLYIGKYDHGIYALPSLIDKNVPVVPDNSYPKRLLIGGPENNEEFHAIILGHYKISSVSKTQLLLTGRTDHIIPTNITSFNYTKKGKIPIEQPEVNENWNFSSESKILAVVVGLLSVFVVGMFMYIMAQVRDIKQSSQGSSGVHSTSNSSYVQTQQGIVTVGKISFDTRQILGKGCEGTFVFRGTFDGRNVAVKRLLPECFTFANREVQLLRESDAHPNVIRYFSTEEDSQFRYIALELCSANLQDYVERDMHKNDISCIEVLKQATMGLEHLHFLKIVHRDIKPHNILLSISSSNGSLRTMISDFGLCKKLPIGKMSLSRRSGITGTEGWIAPEMIEYTGRITSAVDIFSMGCVFYYTTTNGKHPFGEPIRRQSNILNGEYRILLLDELWKSLMIKMLSQFPSERPSASTIKVHPVFWEKSYILTFLQDVSDRLEKADGESEALLNLETGGECVCNGDWRQDIDSEVLEDLGKYRSYRGDSVRDLLRALRNKRHHYRELSAKAQQLLGTSAESYINYWLSKFPTLLYHSWSSLQMLRNEPAFIQYYDPIFVYPCIKSNKVPEWISDPKPAVTKQVPKSPSKYIKRRPKPSIKDISAMDKQYSGDLEKEEWIRTGKNNGAWRPGLRVGKRKETKKEEPLVWKLS
uniref:non-specific serine/threonine protein kinase n=1 Tax=Panstrongylus lignarius TaxID=156445 RepID=A0A224X6K4_9HEMI